MWKRTRAAFESASPGQVVSSASAIPDWAVALGDKIGATIKKVLQGFGISSWGDVLTIIKDAAVSAWTWINENLPAAITGITGFLGGVWSALKATYKWGVNLWNEVGGWSGIMAKWEEFKTTLGTLPSWSDLQKEIVKLLASIAGVEAAIEGVEKAIKLLAIIVAIAAAALTIVQALGLVGGLVAGVGGAVAGVGAGVAGAAAGAATGIGSVLASVAGVALAVVGVMAAVVFLGPLIEDTFTAIGNILTAGLNAISNVVQGIGTLINTVVQGIGSMISTALGTIGNIVGSAISSLGGVIRSIGNAVGEAAEGIGGAVAGVATGVGTAVGGIGQGIGNAVGGIASGVGSAAGGILSGVGSVIGGLAQGIGNVVGGVLGGIGSVIGGFFHMIGFAGGGFITRPTLGMIGEGGKSEGVFPLTQDTFNRFSKGIVASLTAQSPVYAGAYATAGQASMITNEIHVFIGEDEVTDLVAVKVGDRSRSLTGNRSSMAALNRRG